MIKKLFSVVAFAAAATLLPAQVSAAPNLTPGSDLGVLANGVTYAGTIAGNFASGALFSFTLSAGTTLDSIIIESPGVFSSVTLNGINLSPTTTPDAIIYSASQFPLTPGNWSVMATSANPTVLETDFSVTAQYATVQSPVPEPETYALMMAGLVAIGAKRWKKARTADVALA